MFVFNGNENDLCSFMEMEFYVLFYYFYNIFYLLAVKGYIPYFKLGTQTIVNELNTCDMLNH